MTTTTQADRNAKRAAKMKVGDRVRCLGFASRTLNGAVVVRDDYTVEIRWDDGSVSYTHPRDIAGIYLLGSL